MFVCPSDKAYENYFILMRTFQNWPNKLQDTSGPDSDFDPGCINSFSGSFLCLQIIAEISKIKKRTQRDIYFTFNALLKHFNILV